MHSSTNIQRYTHTHVHTYTYMCMTKLFCMYVWTYTIIFAIKMKWVMNSSKRRSANANALRIARTRRRRRQSGWRLTIGGKRPSAPSSHTTATFIVNSNAVSVLVAAGAPVPLQRFAGIYSVLGRCVAKFANFFK